MVYLSVMEVEEEEIPFELECARADIFTGEKNYHLIREGSEGELTTTEGAFDHLTQALNKAANEYNMGDSIVRWENEYKEEELEKNQGCLAYLMNPFLAVSDMVYYASMRLGAGREMNEKVVNTH